MAIAPGSRVLFNELSYGFFNQFIIPDTLHEVPSAASRKGESKG